MKLNNCFIREFLQLYLSVFALAALHALQKLYDTCWKERNNSFHALRCFNFAIILKTAVFLWYQNSSQCMLFYGWQQLANRSCPISLNFINAIKKIGCNKGLRDFHNFEKLRPLSEKQSETKILLGFERGLKSLCFSDMKVPK